MNKIEDIINNLFIILLILVQQLYFLYIIIIKSSEYLYFIILILDIFLCLHILLTPFNKENIGIKVCIQWLIYITTLNIKVIIFSFYIPGVNKYNMNDLFSTYFYDNHDILVYNLLYITPFIYLLFSLKNRNVLGNVFDNKIIIENIICMDANIINLFDLIDVIFMYTHLSCIYKVTKKENFSNIQEEFILLIVVVITIFLFGFYFPIYTNVEKYNTYESNEGYKIKKKKNKEKNDKKKKNNRDVNYKIADNETIRKNVSSYISNSSSSSCSSFSIYPSDIYKYTSDVSYNHIKLYNPYKIEYKSINNLSSYKKTYSYSNNSSNAGMLSNDSSITSNISCPTLLSNVSSSSSSFDEPMMKHNETFNSTTNNNKYNDVYTDVYLSAKFHFIVGFFLIDIPFLIYRLLFCIKYKVLFILIVKNLLFLLFRSYKLNEYRLIEKEKHKKNKSNLDFIFYELCDINNEDSNEMKKYNSELDSKLELSEENFEDDYEEGKLNDTKPDNKYKKYKLFNFFKKLSTANKIDDKGDIKKKKKKLKGKIIKECEILKTFKEEFKNKYTNTDIIEYSNDNENIYNKTITQTNFSLNNMNIKNPNKNIKEEDNLNNKKEIEENELDIYADLTKKKNIKSGYNSLENKMKNKKQVKKMLNNKKREIRIRKKYIKKKRKTFLKLIKHLKYKKKIPVYQFKYHEHFFTIAKFVKKRHSSNFIYFDDKLIFSYCVNIRFLILFLLDYTLKIAFTVLFIFFLINNHITISDKKDLIYMNDIPVKPTHVQKGIYYFPTDFDLTKYPNIKLPNKPISIYHIIKKLNGNTNLMIQININKQKCAGYIDSEIKDNILSLYWKEIFIYDKYFIFLLGVYLILYFFLLINTSSFFDILFVTLFNGIRNLSFYFTLKEFVLFYYLFNGSIYNKNYIYYDLNIRKINYKYEYSFLLIFVIHLILSIIKHIPLFLRIIFNIKYIYCYKESKKKKSENSLRYSTSIYILFLLCKYSYAPINLNALLLGENVLMNILMIDNINCFTWLNIILVVTIKTIQILIMKKDYFIIGLFFVHIILFVIYAIYSQILRYIVLRKIEIIYVFKNIIISKYENTSIVSNKNSPYITCRDILKYYSEEGFFSSEINIVPNYI